MCKQGREGTRASELEQVACTYLPLELLISSGPTAQEGPLACAGKDRGPGVTLSGCSGRGPWCRCPDNKRAHGSTGNPGSPSMLMGPLQAQGRQGTRGEQAWEGKGPQASPPAHSVSPVPGSVQSEPNKKKDLPSVFDAGCSVTVLGGTLASDVRDGAQRRDLRVLQRETPAHVQKGCTCWWPVELGRECWVEGTDRARQLRWEGAGAC